VRQRAVTGRHQQVTVALRTLDHLDAELDLLRGELVGFARRQPACQALDALYGIGPIVAVAIWAELGEVRCFTSSRTRSAIVAWTSPWTHPTASAPRPPSPPGPARAALGAV
jgi:transposase